MQDVVHPLMLTCPPPAPFSPATMPAAADTASSTTSTAPYKKPAAHRRDGDDASDDDELDVFEAASYYSGAAGTCSFRSGLLPSYGPATSTMKEGRRIMAHQLGEGLRRSIDVPMTARLPDYYSQPRNKSDQKPAKEKEASTKQQPISPGGRLASFLNSFFHQRSKKKSKSISAAAGPQYSSTCNDHGDHVLESPAGGIRRKRRSSLSSQYSLSTGRSDEYSSSSYSSRGSSGFRTPASLVFPRGKAKVDPRSSPAPPPAGAAAVRPPRGGHGGDLPRERSRRASTNGILEKGSTGCSYYGANKSTVSGVGAYCVDGVAAEKKWVLNNKDGREIAPRDLLRAAAVDVGPHAKERSLWRREEDEEDGGESDSSSDLFELPNCDLQLVHFASGLPVYETTSMESVKRGPPSMASSTVTL